MRLKQKNLTKLRIPCEWQIRKTIRVATTGTEPGSVGPVGLDLMVIADHAALLLSQTLSVALTQLANIFNMLTGSRDLPEARRR